MDADTSPPLLVSIAPTPVKLTTSSVSTSVTLDVYANLPAPAAAGTGSMFYATDQVALYLSTGIAWLRVGPAMPGDIIWTAEAVARTGYVLLTGQAWPSTTGIYADLYGIWGGANLPDVQGRAFAAKGTHADMATLLGNEGVATVVNRRQKHRTTNALALNDPGHAHPIRVGSTNPGAAGAQDVTTDVDYSGIVKSAVTGITITGSIGTNVGTDPLDTGAYIVLQPQAKL